LIAWALVGRDATGHPYPRTVSGPMSPEDAQDRVATALHWLDHRDGRPFFLWLHLIDPHLPYTHWEIDHGPLFDCCGPTPTQLVDVGFVRKGNLRDTEEARLQLREGYDLEVAYTDRLLTQFLDGLEARGLLDEVGLIFSSDHGEEFWENGGFEHGHALVPPVVEVPLLVRGPGLDGGRISAPASLVDVPTTLAAMAGVELDGPGYDLRAGLPSDRLRRVQGTLYGAQQEAVAQGGFVGVRNVGEEVRVYARTEGWHDDLRTQLPEVQEQLAQALDAEPLSQGEGPAADPNTAALQALGYLD